MCRYAPLEVPFPMICIHNVYTEIELSIFGPKTMDCSKAEISLICAFHCSSSCLTYISTPGVPHTTYHSMLEYYNHISYSFSFYIFLQSSPKFSFCPVVERPQLATL